MPENMDFMYHDHLTVIKGICISEKMVFILKQLPDIPEFFLCVLFALLSYYDIVFYFQTNFSPPL